MKIFQTHCVLSTFCFALLPLQNFPRNFLLREEAEALGGSQGELVSWAELPSGLVTSHGRQTSWRAWTEVVLTGVRGHCPPLSIDTWIWKALASAPESGSSLICSNGSTALWVQDWGSWVSRVVSLRIPHLRKDGGGGEREEGEHQRKRLEIFLPRSLALALKIKCGRHTLQLLCASVYLYVKLQSNSCGHFGDVNHEVHRTGVEHTIYALVLGGLSFQHITHAPYHMCLSCFPV